MMTSLNVPLHDAMAGRFGAFAKLSRDDGDGRPSDTWSCTRCSRRNSPAVERCEGCGASRNRNESRKANMGFESHVGHGVRDGPANWAGPSTSTPVDPATRKDPYRSGSVRAFDATDEAARRKYTAPRRRVVKSNDSDEDGIFFVGERRASAAAEAWRSRSEEPTHGASSSSSKERGTKKAEVTKKAEATTTSYQSKKEEEEQPVLFETALPDARNANQGVSKTDVAMDEDGDAADDFLFAENDPKEGKKRGCSTNGIHGGEGGGVNDSVDLTAEDETKESDSVAARDTSRRRIWTDADVQDSKCVSCGLRLADQSDVPLPVLTKADHPRPDTEVGRWLGFCERECAVALCGPCVTARVTPVLAAATTRLEKVVSGLGTGYTKLDVLDDPYGERERDPPVKCPCRVGGLGGTTRGKGLTKSSEKTKDEKGVKSVKEKSPRCGARLVDPPFAEAETETHKTWAATATEAFFAGKDSRAFAVTQGDFPCAGGEGGAREPMDVDDEKAPSVKTNDVDPPSAAPTKNSAPCRFAICPNFACATRVFLEPAAALPNHGHGLVAERNPTTGKWLSRESLAHQHTKRFRCSACLADFCGDCLVTPYHVGFHLCAAAAAAKEAPKCRYCESNHLDQGTHYFRNADTHLRGVSGDLNVGELRKLIGTVDTQWCVTKDDLRGVFKLTSSVCSSPACTEKINAACSKTHLACGHPCGGIRGEMECLPCLRCPPEDKKDDPSVAPDLFEKAQKRVTLKNATRVPFPDGTEPCCVCYVDELRSEPCIQLGCGHVLHLRCAVERIEKGWPTQNITFEHLRCPLCGDDGREQNERGAAQAAVMSHPSLAQKLAPQLQLREQIMRRARKRLALDANGPPRQIKPGGEWEGRPGEYALTRFNYYRCEKCETPYFGGDRACHRGGVERGDGDGQAPNQGEDAHLLLCGQCSVTTKGKECGKGHGAAEMEYKCRYCCDVAVWFCFGTHHFCDKCHTRWVVSSPDWDDDPPIKGCTPRTCPLRVDHPEHGKEFCLGCAVCRSLKATEQE